MERNNLVLIGMPGAGKSTVGVILAKRIGFNFIDTDLLIQTRQQQRLQQIIDRQGAAQFRTIEQQVLLDLHCRQTVIATGGSVVYSAAGMEALQQIAQCIYLQVDQAQLQKRIANMGQRGLVMAAGQSFAQLFQERTPLYEQYADWTLPCSELSAEEVAAQIERELTRRSFEQMAQPE